MYIYIVCTCICICICICMYCRYIYYHVLNMSILHGYSLIFPYLCLYTTSMFHIYTEIIGYPCPLSNYAARTCPVIPHTPIWCGTWEKLERNGVDKRENSWKSARLGSNHLKKGWIFYQQRGSTNQNMALVRLYNPYLNLWMSPY